MAKCTLTAILIWLNFASAFGQLNNRLAHAQPNPDILIQLTPGTDPLRIVDEARKLLPDSVGLKLAEVVSERFGYYLLNLRNHAKMDSWLPLLRQLPGVISADVNQPLEFRDSIPNDKFYHQQWSLEKIALPPVWSLATGGTTALGHEIVVAIMDMGFDLNHEDLRPNLWTNPGEIAGDNLDNDNNGLVDDIHGWNFRLNSNVYQMENHGTWVAGAMGAATNNGLGVSSPAWNVKVMYLGVFTDADVIKALEYVLQQRERYNASNGNEGAFVVAVNGSFGYDKVFCSERPAWSGLYDPLGQVGVLNVAPPANEDWNVDLLGDVPATCASDFLIVVTSTNQADQRPSFASYGPLSVDVAAPGSRIFTTYQNNEYAENIGGNSLASPLVAALIGLLYSLPCEDLALLALDNPPAAALLIKQAILYGVDPLPDFLGKTVTEGRINATKAMEYLHAYCVARPEDRSAGNFKELFFETIDIVRVFPNPTANLLTVEYGTDHFGTIQLALWNPLGQRVQVPQTIETIPFEKQQITLDVSHLPAGTYFITIVGNESKATRKFIKY